MGSTLFRNPRALSSALAPLGSPEPWVLWFLNSVDPLVSASNYYVLSMAKLSERQMRTRANAVIEMQRMQSRVRG